MKIKYEFADGTVSEVEVEESVGAVIIDSRRKEDNLSRKERYHCYSLDAMQYGDKDKFMPYSEEFPDWLMEQEEYSDHINRIFARLSEVQQIRMLMLASGMLMHEIADREGVDYRAVYDSVKTARKKFLKYFKKTPHQIVPKISVDMEGSFNTPFRKGWIMDHTLKISVSKKPAAGGMDRELHHISVRERFLRFLLGGGG